MKRFMMTVAMALTLTMAFAEGEENEKTTRMAAYDMHTNINMLSQALRLNSDQKESVEVVHNLFAKEMMNAGASSAEEREDMMQKAITRDLAYMRSILTNIFGLTELVIFNRCTEQTEKSRFRRVIKAMNNRPANAQWG